MKLTDAQIKDIAEELDMGMKCYYNIKTDTFEALPDFDNNIYAESEIWEDLIDKIETHFDDYVVFTPMSSTESYRVMQDFASEVGNKELQDRLFLALEKRKPFSNFKWEIDNSREFRQKWFDYKLKRNMEFVKEQLELLQDNDEN